MNLSTPGLPVHHQLPESIQTYVHWVGDVTQLSHPLSYQFPMLTPICHLLPCCTPLSAPKVFVLLFLVENSTYFSPAPFKALPVLLTKITPSSAAPSLLVLFCLVSICFSFGLPCPCSVPQPQTGHSLKAGFFILYLNLYAIIHYLTYSKNAQ